MFQSSLKSSKSLFGSLLLLLLCGILTTGCGFQLRGSVSSLDIAEFSIEGGEPSLNEEIKTVLEQNGSSVVTHDTDVPTIIFTIATFEREVSVADADGIATSYNYNYIVDFNVVDPQGDELLETTTIKQFRSLDYAAGDELRVEEEEEFLREEMEKAIALQIMRRLTRL